MCSPGCCAITRTECKFWMEETIRSEASHDNWEFLLISKYKHTAVIDKLPLRYNLWYRSLGVKVWYSFTLCTTLNIPAKRSVIKINHIYCLENISWCWMKYMYFLHGLPWIWVCIKSIHNKLDITFHIPTSQLLDLMIYYAINYDAASWT